MRLLERGEPDVRVQPQPVIQIRRAAFRLPNDVEVRQAPHAVVLVTVAMQVFPEGTPQVVENDAKAPGVVGVQVAPVPGDIARVLLIPTGVLNVGQEFSGDDGKHL